MRKTLTFYLYVGLMLLPLFAGFLYSFLYSTGSIGLLSKGFNWNSWTAVFNDSSVLNTFLDSALVATISIAISMVLALYLVLRTQLAYTKGMLQTILQIPLAFPPMIIAFFMFQLLNKGGILSRIFFKLGLVSNIEAFPTLVNDNYQIGVIAAMVFLSTPFLIVFFIQKINANNLNDFANISKTLGATHWQTERKVLLPILLKYSWFNIALYWLFLFGNYEIPLILGNQNPPMISVLISQKLTKFNLNDLPQAYVLAILYLFVVIAVFSIFYVKQSKVKNR